jgi:hypothetical protein
VVYLKIVSQNQPVNTNKTYEQNNPGRDLKRMPPECESDVTTV